MKISKENLVKLLKSCKGSTFVTIQTVTKPTFSGGMSCPFVGAIKISRVNGCIGFNYENSVNNQRAREGSEKDFEAKPRTWGHRIPGTPLVKHKGSYYLEMKVEKSESPVYILGTYLLDNNDIKPWIPKQTSRQEVEKPVILRDYKIDSIQKIVINKQEYIVNG